MTDINSLNLDQVTEKIDKLPQAVTDFLSADETEDKFDAIAEKYDFSDAMDEGLIMKQLVLLLVARIITKDELAKQIEEFMYRPAKDAENIAKDILNILSPVLTENQQTNVPLKDTPVAPSAKPQPLGQAKVIDFPAPAPRLEDLPKPSTVPPVNTVSVPKPAGSATLPAEPKPSQNQAYQPKKITMSESPSPAPFIIHEEKESKKTSFDPSRPTFIKPQFGIPSSAGLPPERQPTARVDFGKGIYNFGKPNPTPPPPPTNVKRVDYTAPRTDQSPPPKKNDDQNTLDLRDLPK